MDANGNLYIADQNNNMVRKMTPAGDVSAFAGCPCAAGFANGTGSAARFNQPAGITVGSDGMIYVADTFGHCIRKITPNAEVSLLAGSPGLFGSADGTGTAARFNYPESVAVDGSGNVFVADYSNATIRKVAPDGVVTTFAGSAGQQGGNDGTGSAARFGGPHGLAFDSAGNLFVTDFNNTIRRITPGAVVTTVAGVAGMSGSADGTGTAARFFGPASVAIDSNDNLYITEFYNYTIRKMTPARVVTTLAGVPNGSPGSNNGIGSAARFNFPYGIAMTKGGTLYVVDSHNNTIRGGELPLAVTGTVSRKTHGTAVFDLPVGASPLTVESRTGGPSGNHGLVIAFNHDIMAASATVTSGTASIAGSPVTSANEVLVNLTGATDAQALTLTLNNVADQLGQSLASANISVGFLVGDANGDRIVNSGDATVTRSRSGQSTDASNFLADYNVDGFINAGDVTIARARSGQFIP